MRDFAVWWFIAAITAVGLLRFGLTVSGVPDDLAKYASMTAIIVGAAIYFGLQLRSTRDLLRLSYLIILPYLAVELIGIGYTWSTGRATIFHCAAYSFNLPIRIHFWGHLIGGLTWEPLTVFVLMLLVRALRRAASSRAGRGST